MNIAEGCGRGTDADFARFLQIAAGSIVEVEYQLLLAHELDFLSADQLNDFTHHVIEVKRMLSGLVAKLKADS
jgi:four helix bundle protein